MNGIDYTSPPLRDGLLLARLMARRIHTSESLIEIAHLCNVLEAQGIRCSVRNDRLGGVIGEIPFVECWPELWVEQERDAARAESLLRQARTVQPSGLGWHCGRCGEPIEAQFEQCWSCGALRPVADG
jgi:hypothetical protein